MTTELSKNVENYSEKDFFKLINNKAFKKYLEM